MRRTEGREKKGREGGRRMRDMRPHTRVEERDVIKRGRRGGKV